MDELHNTQTTPAVKVIGKGKGKEREILKDSNIEELDGPLNSKLLGSDNG